MCMRDVFRYWFNLFFFLNDCVPPVHVQVSLYTEVELLPGLTVDRAWWGPGRWSRVAGLGCTGWSYSAAPPLPGCSCWCWGWEEPWDEGVEHRAAKKRREGKKRSCSWHLSWLYIEFQIISIIINDLIVKIALFAYWPFKDVGKYSFVFLLSHCETVRNWLKHRHNLWKHIFKNSLLALLETYVSVKPKIEIEANPLRRLGLCFFIFQSWTSLHWTECMTAS